MISTVDYGDATALIRSINRAADILRRRGMIIDLTKEMPASGSQEYFIVLRALHSVLWAKVRATTKVKVTRYGRKAPPM